MKRKISDLMDLAEPLPVELSGETPDVAAIKASALSKVRQSRPAARRPGRGRMVLLAACCALLLTGTMFAGLSVWEYEVKKDGNYLVITHQKTDGDAGGRSKSLADHQVYLPTVFPGEVTMKTARKDADAHWMSFYEWQWKFAERGSLVFEQWNPAALQKTIYSDRTGEEDYGETTLGGTQVTYRTVGHSHTIMWSDENYLFILDYSGPLELADLADTVNSLQPVSKQQADALLEQYAPKEPVLTRALLQQVLLPGQVPEGLVFDYDLKPDSLRWSMSLDDGYGRISVEFYQEDLDCVPAEEAQGDAWVRWKMQNNKYLEPALLNHRVVQLLGGRDELVWEYFWEQDGNWCSLSVDREVADTFDMTIAELARQITESLWLTDISNARQPLEQLLK